MGNGCGKHAGTNSIYCPSHNAVHENMGVAPSTVVWPCFSSAWNSYHFFKIFSCYIITDSAAPTNRCRNLGTVLQFCTECWVHAVWCWCCWPKLTFTGRPNKFHGMEPHRVGTHAGESYSKLWKWMSYKLLTTFRSAISLHFLWG